MMKKTLLGMFTAIALVTVGCGGNNNNGDDAGTNTPDAGTTPDSGINCEEVAFKRPEGTIALNFSIDATGRPGFYADGELEWKGNFVYDAETRLATNTGGDWAPPFAPLYDDGPWTCGGHEPEGSTAGDDIFGVTMFFPSPSEDVAFAYGAQVAPGPKCADQGGCWIWPAGDNGGFTVPANATEDIDADGMTLSPEGNVDLRITIDLNDLPEGTVNTPPVQLKGSYCSWNPEAVTNEANGVYTYVLSDSPNCLLVYGGSEVRFVWMIGSENFEYKGLQGLTAASKGPNDTEWVTHEVVEAANGDPSFTIPE